MTRRSGGWVGKFELPVQRTSEMKGVIKMFRSVAIGATVALGISMPALAETYTLTNCSNGLGCGTGNDLGTIITTNITGGVDVLISLAPGEVLMGNFSPSVMFD